MEGHNQEKGLTETAARNQNGHEIAHSLYQAEFQSRDQHKMSCPDSSKTLPPSLSKWATAGGGREGKSLLLPRLTDKEDLDSMCQLVSGCCTYDF